MRFPTILLAIAAALAASPISVQAQTNVLSDTYDYTDGSAGQNFDLTTDQATRESGTLAPITYTNASASTSGGANQVYLSTNEAYNTATNPTNGVLDERALIGSTGGGVISSTSTVVNNDLSPAVSGMLWTASYTGALLTTNLNQDNTPVNSWYQAFTLGRGNGGGEPNFASIDFAFQVNYNGTYAVTTDQTNVATGTINGFTLNNPFNVKITLNETGARPTATINVNTGSTSTAVGTYPFDYTSTGTGRYIDFLNRLYVNSTPNTGGFAAYTDGQVDNLAIAVVPEPSSALMLVVAGLGLYLTWRKHRHLAVL